MKDICDEILKINYLSHRDAGDYIKNKLLSCDPTDITHLAFYIKLQVIIERLPEYLEEGDIIYSISGIDERFFKFWHDYEDQTYFYDIKGYIRLIVVRLTNTSYLVSIPTKFAHKITLVITIQ